jgi:hypothetical protein
LARDPHANPHHRPEPQPAAPAQDHPHDLGVRSNEIDVSDSLAAATKEVGRYRFDVCFAALGADLGVFVSFIQAARSSALNGSTAIFPFASGVTRDLVLDVKKAGANGLLSLPFTVAGVEEYLAAVRKGR